MSSRVRSISRHARMALALGVCAPTGDARAYSGQATDARGLRTGLLRLVRERGRADDPPDQSDCATHPEGCRGHHRTGCVYRGGAFDAKPRTAGRWRRVHSCDDRGCVRLKAERDAYAARRDTYTVNADCTGTQEGVGATGAVTHYERVIAER